MPDFACLLDECSSVFCRCCLQGDVVFIKAVFFNKILGFYNSVRLFLEFFVPVGLVIRSGSSWNGLLSSLQDCLVEGLDFGVKVLPFVVDLMHVLINQI